MCPTQTRHNLSLHGPIITNQETAPDFKQNKNGSPHIYPIFLKDTWREFGCLWKTRRKSWGNGVSFKIKSLGEISHILLNSLLSVTVLCTPDIEQKLLTNLSNICGLLQKICLTLGMILKLAGPLAIKNWAMFEKCTTFIVRQDLWGKAFWVRNFNLTT